MEPCGTEVDRTGKRVAEWFKCLKSQKRDLEINYCPVVTVSHLHCSVTVSDSGLIFSLNIR